MTIVMRWPEKPSEFMTAVIPAPALREELCCTKAEEPAVFLLVVSLVLWIVVPAGVAAVRLRRADL